jgi:hypothetical protein
MRVRRIFHSASWLLLSVGCGARQGGEVTKPEPLVSSSAPRVSAPATVAAARPSGPTSAFVPAKPAERWPDGVDGSLPAPQRAQLIGNEMGGERLLAFTGVTSKSEHFAISAEPGVPPPQTQELMYYVTVNAETGCLKHSESFPELGRARTDQSMIVRDRLYEAPAVHNELGRMQALLARFGVRGHDNIAFTPDGKNIFIEASSFISQSTDRGAYFREFGPGAAAMPVVSPSGRYVAMRHCGSPCGGLYKLTITDLVSGTKRTLGPEDTEDIFFAPDDTLYAVRTNGGGLRKATQACVDQTVFPSWVSKRVGCRPSSGLGGSTLSSNGKFLAMLGASSSGKDRAYVLSLPDGKEVQSFEPSTSIVTGFFAGNAGGTVYTQFATDKNQDAVWLGSRELSVGGAAGWLTDTEVAVVPTFPRATDERKPLQTLGDIGACNWLRSVRSK